LLAKRRTPLKISVFNTFQAPKILSKNRQFLTRSRRILARRENSRQAHQIKRKNFLDERRSREHNIHIAIWDGALSAPGSTVARGERSRRCTGRECNGGIGHERLESKGIQTI
jgi:hypothetical protein